MTLRSLLLRILAIPLASFGSSWASTDDEPQQALGPIGDKPACKFISGSDHSIPGQYIAMFNDAVASGRSVI